MNAPNNQTLCLELQASVSTAASTAQELTPSRQRELEHVPGHETVEDLDDGQVEVQGFQTHPCEGDEQEVVKEEGCGDAEAYSIRVQGQPRVQQKDQVQQQECKAQIDQDLRWNVPPGFPVVSREKNFI